MNGFEKIKSAGILFGLALIIAGVLFLVFPEKVITFMAYIAGAVITGYGLFRGFIVAVQWKDISKRYFKLTVSLLSIALGIFLIVNTHITVAALGIVIGIFAILLAFDRFNVAILRKQAGINNTWSTASGFIHLAFGIGMFYSAFTVISIIVSIIGVYLLMAGIMVVLSTSYFFDL
jgi:uncharacterized membrane protein HdeD (DUF308 family)